MSFITYKEELPRFFKRFKKAETMKVGEEEKLMFHLPFVEPRKQEQLNEGESEFNCKLLKEKKTPKKTGEKNKKTKKAKRV